MNWGRSSLNKLEALPRSGVSNPGLSVTRQKNRVKLRRRYNLKKRFIKINL
jgi:hypothetical protein